VRAGSIVLAAAALEAPLVELAALPDSPPGADLPTAFLAALAAGWALGLPTELLRAGCTTYRSELAAA